MSQFPESNPYESPYSYGATSGKTYLLEQARAKVNLPAIFMLILAPLGMILFGVDLYYRAVNDPTDNPFLNDMQGDPAVRRGAEVGAMVGGAIDVVGVICQLVVIFGAIQMRSLKSHSMAMAAAIISCVPCITACCLVGIPFGIWSLVVLNDPLVKQAFES